VIWGTNDKVQNFDFIIFLVAKATERKKLKKILKNILLQNYWPDSYGTLSAASL